MGYQGVAEKDVLDVLADVERRFSIDTNRVYLTGLSMGGGVITSYSIHYTKLYEPLRERPEGGALLQQCQPGDAVIACKAEYVLSSASESYNFV